MLTLLADGWSRGERRDVNPRDILSRMQSVAALHPGDDVMQARAIYWRVCFGPGLEPAVADSLLDEALHLVGDRHPYDRARFMMQQAVILSKQADYADAYRLYMSAAAEFETVGDERLLGYTHYNISYIFLLLGEYAEAEANAVAADSLFARVHGDGLRLDAQMLLASIYERAGDSGKAYDILHEVSRLDSAGMSTAQRVVFLTTYLPYLSDPDSLFKYSDAAYRLAEVTGDSQLYLSSLLNKGWAFIDMGLPDSADHYARAARRLSYGMRTARGREGVYKLLASVNAARRDWDSAYHYQTLYYDTRENARGDGVLADVRTVNLKQEIEKIRINALIEQDKEATRSRAFLVVGLSLLGLLAASVYVICLLKRKMQAEQRRQMERDRQYIAQLNHEMQLVESKNRELSSNAMLLMKKNESLRKAIREMENIHKNYHVDIGDIKSELVSSIKEDESWDSFKLHFEGVHPHFFSFLKAKYPRLTDNELRLCAYIRIGLSNKQIAQILLVQAKAVIQARYRLKKKMGLGEETRLSDYFVSLTLPGDTSPAQ